MVGIHGQRHGHKKGISSVSASGWDEYFLKATTVWSSSVPNERPAAEDGGSGGVLRGLGDAEAKRKEDLRRQQKEDLETYLRHESPNSCELFASPSVLLFPVSRRVARVRLESPSPPIANVDPREEELRQRKKQQQDEQKKWLDEQVSQYWANHYPSHCSRGILHLIHSE